MSRNIVSPLLRAWNRSSQGNLPYPYDIKLCVCYRCIIFHNHKQSREETEMKASFYASLFLCSHKNYVSIHSKHSMKCEMHYI